MVAVPAVLAFSNKVNPLELLVMAALAAVLPPRNRKKPVSSTTGAEVEKVGAFKELLTTPIPLIVNPVNEAALEMAKE